MTSSIARALAHLRFGLLGLFDRGVDSVLADLLAVDRKLEAYAARRAKIRAHTDAAVAKSRSREVAAANAADEAMVRIMQKHHAARQAEVAVRSHALDSALRAEDDIARTERVRGRISALLN